MSSFHRALIPLIMGAELDRKENIEFISDQLDTYLLLAIVAV
jgi:hypothetical protein